MPNAHWHRVFPRASSWSSPSGDKLIDRILADIPSFSVGLLAFGIFTLLVVIKRVNVLLVHLSMSAFLAFVAATLDLGQTLSSARSNNLDELDSVTGLSTASEVGFALSVGFRYLFFWTFAAERLRGESLPPPPPQSPLDRKTTFSDPHSGSWSHWGLPGFILKWSTLALVLVIPLMQVIWRTVSGFDRHGAVYDMEATIEIVTSAVFIFKLILNTYLITATTQSKALLYYTAPILALLINLGLGVGNIVYFTSSETSLGRLLQAVELYILLVFILIMTFFIPRRTTPSRIARVPTFRGLPEKPRQSVFHVSPPEIVTPVPTDPISEKPLPEVDDHGPHSFDGSERCLWNQDDAGEGTIHASLPLARSEESLEVLGPRVAELKDQMNMQSHVLSPAETLAKVRAALLQTSIDGGEKRKELNATSSSTLETRPSDTFSLSSYYSSGPVGRDSPELPPPAMLFPRNGESPVYGLNGIIKRPFADPAPRPVNSITSFDELLRQHQELDNNIAALRLFSANERPPTDTKLPDITLLSSGAADIFAKGLHKHESGSARSDFSLSSFPVPPDASTPPSPGSIASSRQKQLGIPWKDNDAPIPVINVTVHDDIAMDHAPVGSEMFGGSSKVDFTGTQYDVTSFMDDFTVPDSDGQTVFTSAFRSATNQPVGLSDIESAGDEIKDVEWYSRGFDPSFEPATAI